MIAFINQNCFDQIMDRLYGSTIIESPNEPAQDVDTYTLYNLSSLIMRGIRLGNLIPPTYIGQEALDFNNERTFDVLYAQYLLGDNMVFCDMFGPVNNIYRGGNTLILIGRDEYKDQITESLIKFYQQRYGFAMIRIVDSIEDWDLYNEETNFDLVGCFNLDNDKERYTQLVTDFEELMAFIESNEQDS